MSFLAPLYLLGGLAVSLPVLLHLIRRTPRGRQTFSSLMFLSPSPPRITRRSRIEHWLLLALRALVIGLLALAFARPFLRSSANLLLDRGPGRQVAILVDTSASMRRDEVWKLALTRTGKVLDDLAPNDVAALFQFDSRLRTVVGFPEPTVDRATHMALLRKGLKDLSPTWQATKLGSALTSVADQLAASRRERGGDHPGHILVISDSQQGADVSALQGYEWPREVLVTVETIQPGVLGNAAVRFLNSGEGNELRARVFNAADSKAEEFRIGWRGKKRDRMSPTTVYVPVGQARVVKLDARPAGADRLELDGDAHSFDNEFFVGPVVQRQFAVEFLGDDTPEDPRGLRYFLDRVWEETPRRRVAIHDRPAAQPLTLVPGQRLDLIVSTGLSDVHAEPLRRYLESGGVALLLADDEASSQKIAAFLPGVQRSGEQAAPAQGSTAGQESFVLLSEIDFKHPVFAAFAEPQFADFSKIRFWQHQRFDLRPETGARVVAKFDNGLPALWEQPVGKGRVFVFASTWRPADSQLALSSKFVPLLSSILSQAAGVSGEPPPNLAVGDPIILPTGPDEAARVLTPEGTEISLPTGERRFSATDTPGIYQVNLPRISQSFAVNLAASESDTVTLALDRLEQLGVRIGKLPNREDLADRERQLRDLELESRQKLWQWLIVVSIAVLGVETVLAGRAARKQESRH